MKRVFPVVAALTALLAAGGAPAQETPTKLDLSVMSYNVRFKFMDHIKGRDGKLHPWRDRRKGVVAIIRQKDPDILGLQECTDVQQKYLAGQLKTYRRHRSNNVPILWKQSKFVEVAAGHIPLPPLGRYGRGRRLDWVHLRETKTKTDVFVFNMHYSPGLKEPERVKICRFTSEFINKTAGKKTLAILTGDLNIHDERTKGIQIIRDVARMCDPWTDTGTSQKCLGGLWRDPKPWSGTTIDWIMYRRPLRAIALERPDFKWQGEYPSDHLPVFARLSTAEKVKDAGTAAGQKPTSTP